MPSRAGADLLTMTHFHTFQFQIGLLCIRTSRDSFTGGVQYLIQINSVTGPVPEARQPSVHSSLTRFMLADVMLEHILGYAGEEFEVKDFGDLNYSGIYYPVKSKINQFLLSTRFLRRVLLLRAKLQIRVKHSVSRSSLSVGVQITII